MLSLLALLGALLAGAVVPAVAGATVAPTGAVDSGTNGCAVTDVLDRNDDGSTALQPIGFSISDQAGHSYSGLYVNNNGNVTFSGRLGTFTPFSLITTSTPIIAPFFGDVDTRNPASEVVHYGQILNWEGTGHRAFCVNWDGVGVGYYSSGADKLNKFQLVLVDRGDRGAGDFDIVFNYDQIQWETGSASGGSGGLGGSSARAGFSNGSTFNFEITGSAVNGAFLDGNASTGLVHRSNTTHPDGSPFLGRFVFPVLNGVAPGTGSISGHMFNAGAPATGLDGAVTACLLDTSVTPASETSCPGSAFTTSGGAFTVLSLPPGVYRVHGSPADANFTPGVHVSAGSDQVPLGTGTALNGIDIGLTGPLPPVPGTGVGGDGFHGNTPTGTPVVFWQSTFTVSEIGCPGGTGSYTVSYPTNPDGTPGAVIASGAMNDTGVTDNSVVTGMHIFSATVPTLFPNHGDVILRMQVVNCPPGGPPATNAAFTIYIDPSGTVVDQLGHAIPHATVTLYRSTDGSGDAGTFGPVAGGSALMSPANRVNPDMTDASGHFGWDVSPGYYFVRAASPGCTAPGLPAQPYRDSATYHIVATPVTDVTIVLQCAVPSSTQPVLDTTRLGFQTLGGTGASVSDFSTSAAGELLVAFVQADGPPNLIQTVRTVTGGGLVWRRTSFADLSGAGATEVWQAFAPTTLSHVSIVATFSRPADGAITVESFRGAAPALGSVGLASVLTGPARAVVTPLASNSLIVAGAIDSTGAARPAPVAGQSLTTFVADHTADASYWTQVSSAPTHVGTPVTINAGLPVGHRSSMVAVEILPS